jgi:hypothetical protein
LAALLVVAITVPAAALENEFGGYWRTRMVNEGHFDGEKGDDANSRYVDTRTRLYYTAKINDNLKLVNKFEMDATWGESQFVAPTTYAVLDADGNPTGDTVTVNNPQKSLYGDVGADGVRVEVKQSYADFNTGPVNWTVGVQSFGLFRSFYVDPGNDASGIIGRWKILDNVLLAGSWLKFYEGGDDGGNNSDVDAYTLGGGIWFSENMVLKPSITWARSSEVDAVYGAFLLGLPHTDNTFDTAASTTPFGELDFFTYGVDFDMTFDTWGLWVTLFGQDGQLEATGKDIDISAWLGAIGGNVQLGPVDLHGQFFYTPGDDKADDELENVVNPVASYYWSEIMGLGIFDNNTVTNSPSDKPFNMWAANIGTTLTPMEKLSVAVDLWYAERDEDIVFANGAKENELGTELDVVVTYELVEGLNLDLVGAYLWAGDAVSDDGKNDEDPYEFGARLSLSF